MYRHIIVAIDDSPTSRKALDEAITLAKVHDARLDIVHAIDDQLVHVFHADGMITSKANELNHVLVSNGEALVEHAVDRARDSGIEAQPRLLHGHGEHADDMIAEAIKDSGADLLVIGSHGRRGVRRLLLGSIAENLVRKAGISVLIVRGMAD